MNRIDRLTAILIQLQTKRIVKAEEIAHRFEISLRTVYRDVKALMEAGVPIGSEAGTGYFIVDGFHLPPIMFTQDEASAMMIAGKLVERMTDQSVRTAFENALMKVKAVLNEAQRDHLESLQAHIEVLKPLVQLPAQTGNHLSDLQKAIAERRVVEFQYTNNQSEQTLRAVEPIGLFYYSAAWHLIAWCRLRNGFRDFRSDKINAFQTTTHIFQPRSISTLHDYLNSLQQNNAEMIAVVVNFDQDAAQYVYNSRHYFGYVSEENIDGRVQMKFLTADLETMARWLLSYGKSVEIESPSELLDIVTELVEELHTQYKGKKVHG
ncbi:MAG: helix-turn-helix transcriptional regulator [Cytophagales bacterium]